MHQIKSPFTASVTVGSREPTDLTALQSLIAKASQNKLKVIEGALAVERQMSEIISFHFFGLRHERKESFEALVLDSDWCSFSAKWKLLDRILLSYDSVKNREEINQLLGKVMKYRNAFTHGKLHGEADRVWLHYFEAEPRKVELNDEYLKKVEAALITAWRSCIFAAADCGISSFDALRNTELFQSP